MSIRALCISSYVIGRRGARHKHSYPCDEYHYPGRVRLHAFARGAADRFLRVRNRPVPASRRSSCPPATATARAASAAPARRGAMNGMVAADAFEVRRRCGRRCAPGVRRTGCSKSFCSLCGGHVFAGEPGVPETIVGVRFGALHGDPGISPRWRQWISSAPDWVLDPGRRAPALRRAARDRLNIRLIGSAIVQLQCTSNWRGTSAGRCSGSAWSPCGGCLNERLGATARVVGRGRAGRRRCARRLGTAAGCCSA